MNAQTLSEHPASRVAYDLTPETQAAAACKRCVVEAGMPVAENEDERIRVWLSFLGRHLKRVRVTIAEADLLKLAQLLADEGTPADPHAQAIFADIRTLLLTPSPRRTKKSDGHTQVTMTLPRFHDAIAHLMQGTGSLVHVAAALRCWRTVMGRTDSGHFRSDQVIAAMLKVPAPELYIKHLRSRGLEHLGVMFHPNTLARAQKDTALRGVFAGSTEYWARTIGQLEIVTE